MEAHDHVVLGSLVHDIGKFWERAQRLGEYRNDPDARQLDCPWNRSGQYHSHLHVLHTRRFCELLCNYLPFLQPKQSDPDNWINLAARHHVASSPLERLVAAADHFASAEREPGTIYQKDIHRRTRLEPILERVNLQGVNRTTWHRLPLAGLTLEPDGLFPHSTEAFDPPMEWTKAGPGELCLSPVPLTEAYQTQASNFLDALERLPQPGQSSRSAVHTTVRSLLGLMERFLSTVPAATNVFHPDISLFDHSRVTTAIAEGLYLHHEAAGTLSSPETFSDESTAKWRLACGDFSGIQHFIYRITSKGAAKGLRGRSFYIQLLCDGVADHLVRRLGLYPTARIYSAGGKFYLLIPDCKEGPLREAVKEVNAELLQEFQGEVFLGLGVVPVSGQDFRGGSMGPKWKEAAEALAQDRLQRFGPLVAEGEEFFAPQALHPGPPCQVCGRDDADANIQPVEEEGERELCQQCHRLERLGRRLADTQYVFWAWGADQKAAQELGPTIKLPGTDWTCCLLTSLPGFSPLNTLTNSHLDVLNRPEAPDGNTNGYSWGIRFVGRWDRNKRYEEGDLDNQDVGHWEFDDFANHAKGIHRLGVLRMDVDDLGELFIRGLHFPAAVGDSSEMGSLSRVATLSRQLHLFFAGYMERLLQPYPRTQIIYAGGDDLFIIGSWDELLGVARSIREDFQAYCADNPAFTLSGGITLVRGRYPISRAAELAGEAEKAAKGLKRWKGQKQKDALCFLNTPISWEDFPLAEELRQTIESIMATTGNRALLGRLREVVGATAQYKHLSRRNGLDEDELQQLVHWQQWRWQLVYQLERLGHRHPEVRAQLRYLRDLILDPGAQAGQPVLDWLQVPTRWAEFLTREEE